MWNTATRDRMVAIEKKTKRYPSDLTDEGWVALEVFLPQPATRGRQRTTDLREVVNALRYMVRSGCEWRMLPVHFPPWHTVYWCASSPMEPMIVAPYLIRRLSSTSWSRSCAEPIPTQGSRSFPAGGS